MGLPDELLLRLPLCQLLVANHRLPAKDPAFPEQESVEKRAPLHCLLD